MSGFKRVVERILIAPRGSRPFVLERLQCGHEKTFEVPFEWVEKKQFPPKVSKVRERLCHDCGQPTFSMRTYLYEDVVLKKTYSLLEDIAQAVYDAERKDLKNAGRGAVDGGQ